VIKITLLALKILSSLLILHCKFVLTAAESGKTSSKSEADRQKLRALDRYYRRFGKVCHMDIISMSVNNFCKNDL